MNLTEVHDDLNCTSMLADSGAHHSYIQVIFGALYASIFVASVIGNTLVICVVLKNRVMQTITYLFICNLAVSDLMVTLTSLWITPLYAFMSHWIWGGVMCHIFPFFQGSSTFISTLTLLSIAVDRYVAILYPFQRSMTKTLCFIIIAAIWCSSVIFTIPYVTHMIYLDHCNVNICTERWPNDSVRVLYGICVLVLQFGVPLAVISYCYVRIWRFIVNRKTSIASSSSSSTTTASFRRSNYELKKRQKLIKMLIAMVTLFALCWFPVNVMNLLKDFLSQDYVETNFTYWFIAAHFLSMSATCWNPMIYAWLNDKFREEFRNIILKYVTVGNCLKKKLTRHDNNNTVVDDEDVDAADDRVMYTEEEIQQQTPTSEFGDGRVNINYFVFNNKEA